METDDAYNHFRVHSKARIASYHRELDGMTGTILGFHIGPETDMEEQNPEFIFAILLFDEPKETLAALAMCIPLAYLDELSTN